LGIFFSGVLFIFRARLFLFWISFFFFGKAKGAKPPITFCELPRWADRTPYLVVGSEAAGLARVCQTELIGFLPDEAARVSLSNLGRMFFTFGKIRSPWRAGTLADCAFNRVVSARLSHLPLLAWREIPQVFRSFVSRSCKQRFEKLEENGINRFR